MAKDLDAVAEKKLKSRITKFKKVNKDENEKNKFFDQLAVSVEIFLPTKDPEKEGDSIILYTSPEGNISDAEYSYNKGEDFISLPIDDKQLRVIVGSFENDFKLNFVE
ncbi:MAG: hypothetical protein KO202_03175 [Methanobacteriaceae archaeon]|jgi:hypothetical protein|nr:hypothetical protein [Methanobacteriaceae archaeon]